MLYDVLAHGIGAAVRRLIYSCFSSLYAHGDPISIYTRVNTLQSYLASKEGMSRSTSESVRVGLLDFLAHLSLHYGRMLANAAHESMAIASRTVGKSGNQQAVRCAALRLATAVVRGLNPVDRSAPGVHADGWALVQRHAKDRGCEEVRSGCLALFSALCMAGGGPLWREGAYAAEEALRLCLTLSDDSVEAVRDAAFRALGELAAASRGKAAQEAMSSEKRPAKKASTERIVNGCVRACLVAPLAEAAIHGKREACLAASSAWLSYIGSLARHHHGQDATAELLEVATMLITAVSEAGRLAAEARAAAGADAAGELGAGLAGQELPPLQACALYVLRRGVMAALAEAAQRKLLERLAGLLDKRLTISAVVVTMEGLAMLLEAVGEVTDETADMMELLLQPYISSNSAAIRQQASVTMAALAAAHPAAAARMLSGCLDTVVSCAVQMAAPLSAASVAAAGTAGAAGIATVVASGGPGGGGSNSDSAAPSESTTPPSSLLPSRSPSSFSANGVLTAAAAAAGPMAVASPAPSFTSPQRPSTPGTSGVTRPPPPPQRALMDTCHGAALVAARLLLTAARAPLGCPTRLQQRAMGLAEDLVMGPGPELAGNRAICREVGYLLLGSLCSLGVPQATRGPDEMVALWQVALGEAARRELDERCLFRPGGELDLAVQLWWRSVALQALSAYVAALQSGVGVASAFTSGPLVGSRIAHRSRSASVLSNTAPSSSGSLSHNQDAAGSLARPSEPITGGGLARLRSGSGSSLSGTAVAAASGPASTTDGEAAGGEYPADAPLAHLAPLVQPLLELLDTQTYLLDPFRAKGGPGGILAGAAAMFTVSLLELHLRSPDGRIVTSPPHVALLTKACLRPFRIGLSAAAADALTVTALRPLLSADDSPLGPWPLGAEPLEDALHTYTGNRGAPHLPPWLTAEEYAALITSGGANSSPGTSAAALAAAAGVANLAVGGPVSDDDALASFGISEGEYDSTMLPNGLGGGTGKGSTGASSAGYGGFGAGAGGVAVGSASGPADGSLGHGPLGAFPQPLSLEAALLGSQLVLLGRLLSGSPVSQQLQLLDVILAAVNTAKTTARQSRDVGACRRPPLAVAAAVAALAAYGPGAMAARKSKAPMDASDRVPDKILQLAQALLPEESSSAASPSTAAAVVPLSRAAAELFAASAATGTDAWALRVVRALAVELSRDTGGAAGGGNAANGTAVPTPHQQQQRAVVALALGAAHRCRGGIAMQGAVASSTDALVAAASRPGGATAAAWMLHGLWLVACSGGGAFVPRVRTSLQLAEELLVSSYDSPALRAACARLANASVAVLGPEFSLGSWTYERAKSLVVASGGTLAAQATQAAAASASGGGDVAAAGGAVSRRNSHSAESGADGGLGMVLFVQQIILFAPHAVPAEKHVPLLLSRLLSRQPDLRAASALTLRHLAERSADALRPAEAAPVLFAALDGEADARIAGQLRATLTTILTASVAAGPSFWLDLLSDVVFAVGQPVVAASAGGNDTHHGGDDDDVKYGSAAPGGGSGSTGTSPAAKTGKVAVRSVREVLAAPHLRTRHFAAECLLQMVRVCIAADERHRDPAAMEWLGAGGTGARGSFRRSAGGAVSSSRAVHEDLLIAKLQVLVDVGFKLATCPLESLRPHGVRLLTLLVQLFGDVPDPLLPGARLMEQYQAQVVSALRSSLGARQAAAGGLPSFGAGAANAAAAVSNAGGQGAAANGGTASAAVAAMVQHPLLQIAGGTLATVFLESGLAAGDAVVLRRLMELLCAPLAAWGTLRYDPYAEWVGVRARVELLRAHAQCCSIAGAAAARGDALCAGIVAKAQEPHTALLRFMWMTLLTDHAVLSSQPEPVLAVYGSPLLEGGEAAAATSSGAEAGADSGAGAVVPLAATGVSPAAAWEAGKDGASGHVDVCGNGVVQAQGRGMGLTPALTTAVRPVYSAACPVVLAALAGALPPPAELTASVALTAQYRRLLEVALMLLTDAAARLVHAVHEVLRGADAAGGCGGDKGYRQSVAVSQTSPSAPGWGPVAVAASTSTSSSSTSTALTTHVATAATRLAGVLRALQRLFSGGCISASVPAHSAASGGCVPATDGDNVSAAPAPAPLVSPGVMCDVLGVLSATAAHALLPLHQAMLGGLLPTSMAGLLAGILLPCCSMVRELCAAAPEEVLEAHALGDAESMSAGFSEVSNGRSSPSSPRSRDGNDQDAGLYCNGAEPTSRTSGESPCRSVAGEAAEAILVLASVSVPYSYGHEVSAGRGQHQSSPPRHDGVPNGREGTDSVGSGSHRADDALPCWLLLGCSEARASTRWQPPPGCPPVAGPGPEHAAALLPCSVQLLAAAQQLLRRAPWPALEPHVGSLLELPLRVLLTIAPGDPVATAAQRFLESAVAALLARSGQQPSVQQQEATASGTAAPSDAEAEAVSAPLTYAAATILALADAAALHLQSLHVSAGASDGACISSSDGGGASSPAAALLLGRFAALVPPLLSCAAAMGAQDLQPATPSDSSALPSSPSAGAATPSPVSTPTAQSPLGRTASLSGLGAAHGLRAHTPSAAIGGSSRGRVSRSAGSGGAQASHLSQAHSAAVGQQKRAAVPEAAAAVSAPLLSPLAARSCALGVLQGALQEGLPPQAALAVLEATRGAAQEAAAEDPASPRGRWARALLCALVPVAMERVGSLVVSARQPLAGSEQSLVAECLKLLVLAATLATPQGGPAQEGVMQVLVPLLVELAAPAAGPAAASPALRDMAIKLITSLPTAAAGAAFKVHLAAQPPAAKLRLQAALRDATAAAAAAASAPAAGAAGLSGAGGMVGTGPGAGAAAAAAGGPTQGAGRRPAIQLKTTFALPLPNK